MADIPCSLVSKPIYLRSTGSTSSSPTKCTIELMVYCSHLPNLVSAGWFVWRVMPAMFICRVVICIGPFSERVECLEEKPISSQLKLQEGSFLFFSQCVLFPFYRVQMISSSQIPNVFTSAPSLENLCTVPVITSSKRVFIWLVCYRTYLPDFEDIWKVNRSSINIRSIGF